MLEGGGGIKGSLSLSTAYKSYSKSRSKSDGLKRLYHPALRSHMGVCSMVGYTQGQMKLCHVKEGVVTYLRRIKQI